ncbi:hypothetical protein [Streptomyces hirsutus]|uniref:hypothetical protein n=1 Tax=Streptomyces hirsutus TaxID=35620 RepID=UPI0036AD0D73
MTLPSATRIHVLSMALRMCLAGAGACFGFVLGGWWGAGVGAGVAGLGAEGAWILYRRRVVVSLCAAGNRGEVEGAADAVLVGISLYKAAVFPLTPKGVSEEEQQARRTVAYRLAAHESLPRAVRISAAAALEALDEGPDAAHVRAAVEALTLTVYECRAGR